MTKDLSERLLVHAHALVTGGTNAGELRNDLIAAAEALAALKAEMREDEKAMQEAVTTYLAILHGSEPLGNRAKALRNRITTLACILFEGRHET